MIDVARNRRKRILTRGSQNFVKTPVIPAGSIYIIDLEQDTEIKKYLPLNSLKIVNNSSSTVIIYINQSSDDKLEVIPNEAREIEDRWFRTLKIQNVGTVDIAKGDLIISMRRKPITTDNVIQKVVELLA